MHTNNQFDYKEYFVMRMLKSLESAKYVKNKYTEYM